MSIPETVPFPRVEDLPEANTRALKFNGHLINLTSAPEDSGLMDITGRLSDRKGFYGQTDVHDLVVFGEAMNELLNEYQDKSGFFKDKNSLPDRGIIILSEHIDEARTLVGHVNGLAKRLNADKRNYDDLGLAGEYYDAAKAGYDMLTKHLPEFGESGRVRGVPLSLERAGLVTTRLAAGVGPEADIDGEIRVVTKRAHPKEKPMDLMATVRWRNLANIERLRGTILDIADFVNPASWASTAAALLSARSRGGEPSAVVHRSFMATDQGIVFSSRILKEYGIRPYYYAVGTSYTLDTNFYLKDPAVGDAGHILRHFLPSWAVEDTTLG